VTESFLWLSAWWQELINTSSYGYGIWQEERRLKFVKTLGLHKTYIVSEIIQIATRNCDVSDEFNVQRIRTTAVSSHRNSIR